MTDQTSPDSSPAPAPAPAAASKSRGPLFMIFGAIIVVAVLLWGGYELLFGGKTVSTDNAYVNASSANVTAQITAPVITANIYDTKPVKKGDVLVVLDNTDTKLALAQAQAQLDQVTRQVSTYYANDATLQAQANAANAQVAAAQAALVKAQKAYDDRKTLVSIGAVTGEDLASAKAALGQATAALNSARAQAAAAQGSRASNDALISNVSVGQNPQVVAAEVKVQQAQVDLDRTVIRAPIDGVIAKNTVEVGQRVEAGSPLMEVVPIQNAYVNANFKEVQLKKVQIGQPVVMTADVYGGSVKFHGKVIGLSGGTGSAFSVIPAQNATGNWIKVVQRLPVRISLDPKELQQHPLRVGMSMNAKIDVSGVK
ncbi:HlyD family efflux transporter periplasmic adaptor subunit [Asticcacaulis sp. EMRT-3]|uniref:HlyD family secretion protein n=1 Tax=Asticcacaulis sp. EMRT-3 TaxID=3040349 RepID=UPI0024AEBAA5|nr:HlyD family efflux transporter periplasmic adaptor subunit [Asticcacaulis sp. EMRT-3]MDI7776087.1 HlyD family efflux transporter periplasmic adaptor subunit [Asticcacaulis sp. EMRT-3]